MTPLSVKERIAKHMADNLYDNLIALTRAKDLNVNLYSKEIKNQKLTDKEIRNVSDIYGDRFVERYYEIVGSSGHKPNDEEAKALHKECIEYAFERFYTERNISRVHS